MNKKAKGERMRGKRVRGERVRGEEFESKGQESERLRSCHAKGFSTKFCSSEPPFLQNLPSLHSMLLGACKCARVRACVCSLD